MRLIDADELIEDFKNELLKVDFENLSENDRLIINTSAIALRDFVKRQPTVYCIDKVIERIKKMKKENVTDCGKDIVLTEVLWIIEEEFENGIKNGDKVEIIFYSYDEPLCSCTGIINGLNEGYLSQISGTIPLRNYHTKEIILIETVKERLQRKENENNGE